MTRKDGARRRKDIPHRSAVKKVDKAVLKRIKEIELDHALNHTRLSR